MLLTQPRDLQGKSTGETREMLRAPHVASGVADVVSQFAGVVPAFKAVRRRDVGTILRTAADQLCFVETCSTRILLVASGADVALPGSTSEVRFEPSLRVLLRT